MMRTRTDGGEHDLCGPSQTSCALRRFGFTSKSSLIVFR